MIINPEYEKLLIKRMNDLHEYLIRGIMLRHELWHSWVPTEGEICWEITQSRYMSISEAATYINYSTGEFKPGEYAHVCPDNVEHAFAKFKQIVRLQNDLLRIPATTILSSINAQLKTIKEMVEKIRSTVGEKTANARLKQLLDAYPHLRNTFPIKGVNEMNFDMKICYLDAVTSWTTLDLYTVGRQKRLCGMYDDIVRSYAEQRLEKEGANKKYYHVSMKPKDTYNVERNGKLIQGWGGQKITDKSTYRGQYLNGMKNGYGEYHVEKNYWYRGSIVDEIIEGYGVCLYENGDCYEGWWNANDWHGYGSLHKADGSVQTGEWNHNSFVKSGAYEEPFRLPPMVEKDATPTKPATETTFAKPTTTTTATPTKPAYSTVSSTYAKPIATTSSPVKPASTTTSTSSTKPVTPTKTSDSSINHSNSNSNSQATTSSSTIKKMVLDDGSFVIKEEVGGKVDGFKFSKFATGGGCFSEAKKFHKHGLGFYYVSNDGYTMYIVNYKDNKKNGIGLKITNGTAVFGIWENDNLIKEFKKYTTLDGFELGGVKTALNYSEAKIFEYSNRREVCMINSKGEKAGCCLCKWKDGKKYLGHVIPGSSTGIPLMAGLGIFYYPDGCYYVGSVFNEKAHGIGMRYNADGTYLCGKWSFDKFNG